MVGCCRRLSFLNQLAIAQQVVVFLVCLPRRGVMRNEEHRCGVACCFLCCLLSAVLLRINIFPLGLRHKFAQYLKRHRPTACAQTKEQSFTCYTVPTSKYVPGTYMGVCYFYQHQHQHQTLTRRPPVLPTHLIHSPSRGQGTRSGLRRRLGRQRQPGFVSLLFRRSWADTLRLLPRGLVRVEPEHTWHNIEAHD